jgi:hypothetical protein
MSGRQWSWGFGAIAALAGVLLVAAVVVRWSPTVPANAAMSPVARTAPATPHAHDCLARIERASGYMDVCWDAARLTNDADPEKDYYLLTAWATFGPAAGGSPRWAVLKADLVGSPAGNVMTEWPAREYDGPCEPQPADLGMAAMVPPGSMEVLCGRTVPIRDDRWVRGVTWTCEGCLLPDDRDRALNLAVMVGVPEGTVPEWDIYADVGGDAR